MSGISAATFATLPIIDLGTLGYQAAWDRQLEVHTRVLSGELASGALILVEHPPVVTIGRRPDAQKHLLAPVDLLKSQGIEVIETDRGGDITFHGPGQLVAYPIIPLNYYNLNLHAYMRFMEEAVIQTLAAWHIPAYRDPAATGVWVNFQPSANGTAEAAASAPMPSSLGLAKICALGIKLRRWVSLHGLALNVTTNLDYFSLINPCGLSRPVISMQKLLGAACPAMADVKGRLAAVFEKQLAVLPRVSGAK